LTVHAYGYFVRAYPIGIGKDSTTPLGKLAVLSKAEKPQYTDPHGRVIDGDDPQNPLGPRWLDLGNSYGIHGTIDPTSIGKAESRGCIRLRNNDVLEVFDMLGVGSEVTIRP
jgi:L,D-transpeptidase ErfK/SrfK